MARLWDFESRKKNENFVTEDDSEKQKFNWHGGRKF